jgi:hypothetical protein
MPQILDEGGIGDRNRIELATSKNRRIPNARPSERAPDALAAAMKLCTENHPTVRVRSLSATYNCIGMVFANRRNWIDPSHVQMILDDDGYREVDRKDVRPGDIVIYRDVDGSLTHAGVVISNEPDLASAHWKTTVLSQWGADGEYFHDLGDVNVSLGTPDGFYSERRP